jgi:hypothetical protein
MKSGKNKESKQQEAVIVSVWAFILLLISNISQNYIDAGPSVTDNATFEGQHEEIDGGN